MIIGLIGSGSDMIPLWHILHTYDFSYILWYDDLYEPYGDKSYDFVYERIGYAMQQLATQGVTHYILPPVYELAYQDNPSVMPIFRTYLSMYCFRYSLVGKIGLFGEYSDSLHGQEFVKQYAQTYQCIEHQLAIKRFHFPFAYWYKSVPLWKSYIRTLSISHTMVHRVIKHDMRYFKDAYVDTVIPLQYGYFVYSTVFRRFFTFSKTRFHGWDAIEQSFGQCISSGNLHTSTYHVTVVYTDSAQILHAN